jgi:hypothetical protein
MFACQQMQFIVCLLSRVHGSIQCVCELEGTDVETHTGMEARHVPVGFIGAIYEESRIYAISADDGLICSKIWHLESVIPAYTCVCV